MDFREEAEAFQRRIQEVLDERDRIIDRLARAYSRKRLIELATAPWTDEELAVAVVDQMSREEVYLLLEDLG